MVWTSFSWALVQAVMMGSPVLFAMRPAQTLRPVTAVLVLEVRSKASNTCWRSSHTETRREPRAPRTGLAVTIPRERRSAEGG